MTREHNKPSGADVHREIDDFFTDSENIINFYLFPGNTTSIESLHHRVEKNGFMISNYARDFSLNNSVIRAYKRGKKKI